MGSMPTGCYGDQFAYGQLKEGAVRKKGSVSTVFIYRFELLNTFPGL